MLHISRSLFSIPPPFLSNMCKNALSFSCVAFDCNLLVSHFSWFLFFLFVLFLFGVCRPFAAKKYFIFHYANKMQVNGRHLPAPSLRAKHISITKQNAKAKQRKKKMKWNTKPFSSVLCVCVRANVSICHSSSSSRADETLLCFSLHSAGLYELCQRFKTKWMPIKQQNAKNTQYKERGMGWSRGRGWGRWELGDLCFPCHLHAERTLISSLCASMVIFVMLVARSQCFQLLLNYWWADEQLSTERKSDENGPGYRAGTRTRLKRIVLRARGEGGGGWKDLIVTFPCEDKVHFSGDARGGRRHESEGNKHSQCCWIEMRIAYGSTSNSSTHTLRRCTSSFAFGFNILPVWWLFRFISFVFHCAWGSMKGRAYTAYHTALICAP